MAAKAGARRVSGTTADLYSVALLADGKTALAVGGDGTILRSGDGGQSWSAAVSGTKAIPDLGGAVGRRQDRAGGGLGRHDPAQRRWRPKLERGGSGTTATLTSVALLADGKTALAVGAGGTILRSGDGGQSWSAARSGTTADPVLGGAVGRRQDRAGGGSWGHDPAQRRWRPKLERGGFGDHGDT